VSLRRPTNHNSSNPTATPFVGCGATASSATRNCMTCGKWRSQAGGRVNPRTRMWQCAGCAPIQPAPEQRRAA
jgi:hypothetical protein